MKLFGIKLFQGKAKRLKLIHKNILESEIKLDQILANNQEVLRKISIAKQDLHNRMNSAKSELQEKVKKANSELKEIDQDIEILKKEQSKGNPYLANMISEYFFIKEKKVAEILKRKKHPAIKASERVREIATKNRELRTKFKTTYNRIKLYEEVFPFISDLEQEDIDFILEQKKQKSTLSKNEDPVRYYVPEYDKLSEEERNKRALQRYLDPKWKKSNWEIGKMYERYVGYLYEQKGYKVEYIGIEKGFDDLGRDLVCKNDKETLVVQCKYWASHKEIREAHINQLYGTTVKHFIDEFKNQSEKLRNTLFPDLLARDEVKIKPVFFTSTKLSKTAEDFANALGIQIIQKYPFDQNYPMIKCNLNSQTGEKIYHLPIDQQYDSVLMQNEERIYVKTVKEAMELGCRRAYRWNPNKE